MYTCVAILAALYRREKTGEGATIDMALFDTQLAMLANQASNALVSGKDPPRQGNTHPNIVPYQPFDAADQPIIIAVGNDRQFARLAEICGHPEWASDERFATNGARVANRAEMVALVGEAITPAAGRRSGSISSKPAGIPAGPINRISQALADVQAQHRADGARRSPECRWSARRFASMANGRTADLPPPRLASIRTRFSRSSASTPTKPSGSGPPGSSARPFRRLARAFDQQVELLLAAVLDQHLRRADQVGRAATGTVTMSSLLLSPVVRPFDLSIQRLSCIGSAAGQAVSALPAAQFSSWTCPSAERILTVTRPSLSGRHSCSLRALRHAHLAACS